MNVCISASHKNAPTVHVLVIGKVNRRPTTPMNPREILHAHKKVENSDNHFDYQSVFGMLMYLLKGSLPDLAFPVHQCVRYSADPRIPHGAAIKYMTKYLVSTRTKGTVLKLNLSRTVELYVDANLFGWMGQGNLR